jgi:hypothetical protein
MDCRVAFSVALAVMASATAASGGELRAVVELFTSQGCSSCPPADKLVGELSGDPTIVALSLPIDYWDYLGWKDTLAKPRHTARQRAYAAARGDREVYTPQIVVNGVKHVLGSDKAAIETAIAETKGMAGTLAIPVTVALAGDRLHVTLAAGKDEHIKGDVWLCTISKNVPVAIKHGENSGHTVTYHNVVRRWIRLGEWTGTARTFTVPAADVNGDGADEVAVMVQSGTAEKPGRMLGAATLALR